MPDARLLDDRDPPVARLANAVRGRHREIVLADAPECDRLRRHAHTDEGIRDSVGKAERAIEAAAGVSPRPWFRCPYGQGDDDPRVVEVLDGIGYRNVGWDVDHKDWQPERTAAELVERVTGSVVEHGDGAVVLLHVWPDATLAAMPTLMSRLRDAGAELVGLDELA